MVLGAQGPERELCPPHLRSTTEPWLYLGSGCSRHRRGSAEPPGRRHVACTQGPESLSLRQREQEAGEHTSSGVTPQPRPLRGRLPLPSREPPPGSAVVRERVSVVTEAALPLPLRIFPAFPGDPQTTPQRPFSGPKNLPLIPAPTSRGTAPHPAIHPSPSSRQSHAGHVTSGLSAASGSFGARAPPARWRRRKCPPRHASARPSPPAGPGALRSARVETGS